MSPVVRRLALALSSTLLCLAALEGVARLLAPVPVAPPSQKLVRGNLTEPGDHPDATPEYSVTVHVNAHGFVDTEWPDSPPDVLVIGDSFVQAAQVPLNAGFGRELADATGLRVESMGVPGAGTGTALGVLETYGLQRRPRLVLLGLLVGNDVLNNSPALDSKRDKPFYDVRADGSLVLTDRAALAASQGPLPALWSKSALWRYGWQQWTARAVAKDKVARGNGVPIDFRVYDPAVAPEWEHAWRVTGALVQRMAEVCAHAGVPFGVVLFPDAAGGTASGEARMHADWPITTGWDPAGAHERALALLTPLAPVVDLRPAVRAAEAADPTPLYFPQDGHWTARGHAVAALGAAPFVRTLLPSISACPDGSPSKPQESP